MLFNTFFIGLIIFFVLSIFGLVAGIGYWVYQDAKVRSDKPGIWALIAVATPNLFGLIIYLLVGRTKPGKSDRKHKYPMIISIVCVILSFGILLGGMVNMAIKDGDLPVFNGVSIGQIERSERGGWRVSYKTSGDTLSRRFLLDEEELEAFYVVSECEEGKITFIISQNDFSKTQDISNFEGNIDLSSEFDSNSRIQLTIENESVRNGKFEISWR